MTRVLITGASGFLGSAITAQAALRSDWEVYAVTSGRRPVAFPPSVHPVTADLRDMAQCDALMGHLRPEKMIHLAWNLESRDFLNTDDNLTWLEIGLQLLRSFLANGGQRFLFSGSSAEYGYALPVCRETQPGAPSDLYGMCKAAFTSVAQRLCENHGASYVTARYFSVYGPGETHLLHVIPLAIDALLSGRDFTCKGPNNVWDYVYIDDAAKATVHLLASDAHGVVNIASGHPAKMREVFDTLGQVLGCPERIFYENEDQPGRTLVADTARLQSLFPNETVTALQTGLTNTIAWWKDQKNKSGAPVSAHIKS